VPKQQSPRGARQHPSAQPNAKDKRAASDDAGPKRSTIKRKLILLGTALAIGLVVCEVLVRAFFSDLVDTDFLTLVLRVRSIADIKKASNDPVLGFELKRNLSVEMYGHLIVTDDEGHRIPKNPVRVPDNAVRVAVIGDSSSFGWGVNYEYSYPYLFREQMETITKVPVELKNFSVPAYDSKQEARMFQTRGLPYKPDLLILHHDDNDASPPLSLWGSDGLPPTYGDNILHSALLKSVLRSVKGQMSRDKSTLQRPFDMSKHEIIGRGGYIASGPLYDEHLAALREIASTARERGIPVIAVLFNAYTEYDPQYEKTPEYIRLHQRLSVFLGAEGVCVLDLYPLYQRKMREAGWTDLSEWWVRKNKPEDPHPNAEGHRFIAHHLVEQTRNNPRLMKVFSKPATTHAATSHPTTSPTATRK